MSNGRRGASPSVARSLNGDGAVSVAPRSQSAKCPLCKSPLDFYVGTLIVRVEGQSPVRRSGVTLERCSDELCPNAVPHMPVPTDTEPRKRYPPRGH